MKTKNMPRQTTSFSVAAWWICAGLMLFGMSGCGPRHPVTLAQSGTAARTNPPESTVDVYFDDSPILIRAQLNDVSTPYTFMLDTGGFTIIRPEVAAELGLPKGVAMWIYGASGRYQDVNMLTLDSVRIGDMEVRDCGAGVSDFADKSWPPELAGYLGSNVLRHFRVSIDYRENTVTLADSVMDEPIPPGAIEIPFTFDSEVLFSPVVQCRIDDRLDGEAVIDTGFFGVVAVHVDTVAQTDAFADDAVIAARGQVSAGVFGVIDEPNYAFRLREFRLGDKLFRHLLGRSHQSISYQMLVGNDFLQAYDVILDYPAKKMILIPNGEPMGNNPITLGVVLVQDEGKTIVAGVWEDSAAARAGLDIGDEIVRVNGRDTTKLSAGKVWSLLEDSDDDEVKLEYDRAGVRRTISLVRAPLVPIVDD
jgi:predicted aspartyl protease